MTIYVTKHGEKVPSNLATVLKQRENSISYIKYKKNPITEKVYEMQVIDRIERSYEVPDKIVKWILEGGL